MVKLVSLKRLCIRCFVYNRYRIKSDPKMYEMLKHCNLVRDYLNECKHLIERRFISGSTIQEKYLFPCQYDFHSNSFHRLTQKEKVEIQNKLYKYITRLIPGGHIQIFKSNQQTPVHQIYKYPSEILDQLDLSQYPISFDIDVRVYCEDTDYTYICSKFEALLYKIIWYPPLLD